MKRYIRTSTDTSNKYVIVNIPKRARPEDAGKPRLFIDSRSETYSNLGKVYMPNFTSTRANNLSRAKLFNSEAEAQAFIDKQDKEKDLWKYTPVSVMPYSEVLDMIGNPDDNYKAYKQKQADDRKAASKQYAERNKERNKKNKEYSPGTYKVLFYYSNSWLGAETYTVEAESIDDAFKKAKAKALRQDPYRDTSGYDEKMSFNKQNIWKIK